MDPLEFSDDQVKKTILSWYMILSVCFLWACAAIGGISLGLISYIQDNEVSIYTISGLSYGLIHVLLLYFALALKDWGRIFCLVVCVLYMPIIPLGTLIGITGYIGFRDARPIYVGDRSVLNVVKKRY